MAFLLLFPFSCLADGFLSSSNGVTLIVATPGSGQYLATSNGTTVLLDCGQSVTYLTVTNGTTINGSAICTPPTINTLRYWWVASDMSSGVTVSNQWADRIVGNLAAQGAVAQQPTNSVLGVRFNGSPYNLTNSTVFDPLVNNTTGSVFIVFQPETPVTSLAALVASSTFYGVYTTSANTIRVFGLNGSPTICDFSSGQKMDLVITFTVSHNGNNMFYTNGVSIGSGTAGSWENQKYFGGDGARFLKGYIMEVAYYDRNISAAAVNTLHTYATNKYSYSP